MGAYEARRLPPAQDEFHAERREAGSCGENEGTETTLVSTRAASTLGATRFASFPVIRREHVVSRWIPRWTRWRRW